METEKLCVDCMTDNVYDWTQTELKCPSLVEDYCRPCGYYHLDAILAFGKSNPKLCPKTVAKIVRDIEEHCLSNEFKFHDLHRGYRKLCTLAYETGLRHEFKVLVYSHWAKDLAEIIKLK